MTPGVPAGVDPAELKACCAAVYEHDLVALVLGPSYHPGGRDLTRRLARALDHRPGDRVLDVASGPGTTALLLAEEFGVTVDGVDAGALTVERARTGARQRHLADRVRFCCADAEALPFDDGAFDAVVCECAFCTFPAQEAAAAEFARVLRPGGWAVLADVHPLTTTFGGAAVFPSQEEGMALPYVPNLVHLASEYVTAARAAGLEVAECHEPPVPESAIVTNPAYAVLPDAVRAAIGGLPYLLVWRLTRP